MLIQELIGVADDLFTGEQSTGTEENKCTKVGEAQGVILDVLNGELDGLT
ncbi:MAG: hypothetical protein OXC62_17690 [Aestuariivita sp.]|nr:hypothetical protein [Aestuariivita sp.]